VDDTDVDRPGTGLKAVAVHRVSAWRKSGSSGRPAGRKHCAWLIITLKPRLLSDAMPVTPLTLFVVAAAGPTSIPSSSVCTCLSTRAAQIAILIDSFLSTSLWPAHYINGRHIKRVVSFKLLGVVISSDLTWDSHFSYILSKSFKRIYCIFESV